MRALPPVLVGAVQDTAMLAFPTSSAETLVGDEGAINTAVAADALEDALVPTMLVAVTVNV